MMCWRLQFALAVTLFMLFACNTHAADAISTREARALSPAVAKVSFQRAVTTALLRECGQHYPRLKPAAEQATTNWLHANRNVLSKADNLQQRLLQSIQQAQSRLTAETFALDIDQAVNQNVTQLKQNLAAYPRQQQHMLCNHLILAVNAGEWDVQRKQVEAFAIVQNYHE